MVTRDALRIPNCNSYEVENLPETYLNGFLTAKFLSSYRLVNEQHETPVSQLGQDAFALAAATTTTFLEIGGGDGYHLSNSFNLWTRFGWTGAICEPLPRYVTCLNLITKANKGVYIVPRAISGQCGELELVDVGELSSIETVAFDDSWSQQRREALDSNGTLRVEASCPLKLIIDLKISSLGYLSLDVEGLEIAILDAWPWESLMPNAISVENSDNPEKIQKLDEILISKKYKRVLSDLSKWDCWYVLDSPASIKPRKKLPQNCGC